MKKALIALSGGVDSSVAALLMQKKGYECVGAMMTLHGYADTADAKAVADKLGIPFYALDYRKEFEEKIIKNFVESYKNGQTPNPCVDCNKYMKFGKLFEKADELGCDTVVTGHYVRNEYDGEKWVLKKALDETKDQSYVLYQLTQTQLSRIVFPLSELSKAEVRRIAEENGFANADKEDSQDICFVPDGDYASVINQISTDKCEEGNFVDAFGNILGRHKGIIHYTIGQRKGLGISAAAPLYVTKIDVNKNEVVLGSNDDLFDRTVKVLDVNWLAGRAPISAGFKSSNDNCGGEFRCKAKIRYRHKEQDAIARVLKDGNLELIFDEPQRAATPGQSAVLYDGDIVLGGGVIYK